MNSLIATVQLNIGEGQRNPVLEIYSDTDVSLLVANFIKQQELPSHLHTQILSEIITQLFKYIPSQTHNLNCEGDQDSTTIGEELEPIQKYGWEQMDDMQNMSEMFSEGKSGIPYTPIQRLKAISVKSNRYLSNGLSETQEVKNDKKQGYQKEEQRMNKWEVSFKQITQRRLRRIFRQLKGEHSHFYLRPGLIEFGRFSSEMLDHLEMFFKEFQEDDFDRLNEDKFLSLAYKKEFSEKLSRAFGKWQTV